MLISIDLLFGCLAHLPCHSHFALEKIKVFYVKNKEHLQHWVKPETFCGSRDSTHDRLKHEKKAT